MCYRVPARTARISEAALASRGEEGKCHEQPEAVPDRQRPDAAQEHIYCAHQSSMRTAKIAELISTTASTT